MTTPTRVTVHVLLRRSAFGVGVVVVGTWMALWGLVAFIGFPLGADGLCADRPDGPACGSAFLPAWYGLMVVEAAAALATLLLWLTPGRRAWGFVVGLLGTGGTAIAFALAFGLPLT